MRRRLFRYERTRGALTGGARFSHSPLSSCNIRLIRFAGSKAPDRMAAQREPPFSVVAPARNLKGTTDEDSDAADSNAGGFVYGRWMQWISGRKLDLADARALWISALPLGCDPCRGRMPRAAGGGYGQQTVPVLIAKAEQNLAARLHAIRRVEAFSTVTSRRGSTAWSLKFILKKDRNVKRGDLLF